MKFIKTTDMKELRFYSEDFAQKKLPIGIQYITRREKLPTKCPQKAIIILNNNKYVFYNSERMPLTGMKYHFINHETKNIITFW